MNFAAIAPILKMFRIDAAEIEKSVRGAVENMYRTLNHFNARFDEVNARFDALDKRLDVVQAQLDLVASGPAMDDLTHTEKDDENVG